MSAIEKKFDVVVVGAGSAGSAAALLLARAGRTVALVEKLSLAGAGARWINGIAAWLFSEAGIALPREDELHHPEGPMLMIGPSGERISLDQSPLQDVYMDRLIARLQSDAQGAGVEVFEGARLGELVNPSGRPEALELSCQGKDYRLWARLFVDASGMAGAIKNRLPELSADWPVVPREHLATAYQQVLAIDDSSGAKGFLREHQAETGQVITFSCVEGGWSIINVQLAEDLKSIDLLSGCIDDGAHPSGRQMLDTFCEQNPWIGQQQSGGGGLIPIRRPYDRLISDGLALIGDAACMVFPMHGSGVGAHLIAARILAEAVSHTDDPGDFRNLWDYQKRFQRQLGSVHAAYDVLRRTIAGMDPLEVGQLFGSGLLNKPMILGGLNQTMPPTSCMSLSSVPGAVLRSPLLAAKMAPTLARMGAVYSAYKAYPPRPSVWAMRSFSMAVATIMGDPADMSSPS